MAVYNAVSIFVQVLQGIKKPVIRNYDRLFYVENKIRNLSKQ